MTKIKIIWKINKKLNISENFESFVKILIKLGKKFNSNIEKLRKYLKIFQTSCNTFVKNTWVNLTTVLKFKIPKKLINIVEKLRNSSGKFWEILEKLNKYKTICTYFQNCLNGIDINIVITYKCKLNYFFWENLRQF